MQEARSPEGTRARATSPVDTISTPTSVEVTNPQAREVIERRFDRASPEAVASLLRRATLKTYEPGVVVCRQGDYEDEYSVIIDGQLDIYMDEEAGRTFVAYLRGGQSLGGLEYLTGTARIADAVASGSVTMLEMTFDALDEVVRTDPEILRAISREVVTALLDSQDRFIRLAAASSASTMADHEVFISYARADAEFAKKLATGLRRFGVAVWVDLYNITAGKSWARQVGEALDRCATMLLVVSPRSMASDNSDDEWNYFLDKKKPVVPVLEETTGIPYRLNKLQYVDFATKPFDSALTELVVALRRAAR